MKTVITIVNSNNTIKLLYDTGEFDIISKWGAKVNDPGSGDIIYLIDINRETYALDFNSIVSPVAASKSALLTIIQNYLD